MEQSRRFRGVSSSSPEAGQALGTRVLAGCTEDVKIGGHRGAVDAETLV
jgi:hypothetical protein